MTAADMIAALEGVGCTEVVLEQGKNFRAYTVQNGTDMRRVISRDTGEVMGWIVDQQAVEQDS